MNDTGDDTWDNKATNRISAIHFLDDDEEDDEDTVRPASSCANFTAIHPVLGDINDISL